MQRRTTVLALLMALVLLGTTATVAPALSEWWTPAGASCPSFDSEEACLAYCRQAPDTRCGGSASCTWRTGDQRPEC